MSHGVTQYQNVAQCITMYHNVSHSLTRYHTVSQSHSVSRDTVSQGIARYHTGLLLLEYFTSIYDDDHGNFDPFFMAHRLYSEFELYLKQ